METFIAFLFGLLIGSFLNVCIYRWPRDLSVVRPRSHCTSCEKTIAWYDNIPVLSYLALRGRCRRCGTRISFRYPAVELITAACFAYLVAVLGPGAQAVKMCFFSAALIGLVFSDLEERILPDELTLGGAAAGFVFAFFTPAHDISVAALASLFGVGLSARAASVAESAAGMLIPAGFLFFGGWLYEKVRHREGLGFGDVKLVAMIGAFLGLRGALFTVFIGSVAGSILGYGYIKLTGKDPSTYELPFGTFLGAAALLLALAGPSALP
jgi:leader peptidase (prepilin peptidase) / N-methyltransferase